MIIDPRLLLVVAFFAFIIVAGVWVWARRREQKREPDAAWRQELRRIDQHLDDQVHDDAGLPHEDP